MNASLLCSYREGSSGIINNLILDRAARRSRIKLLIMNASSRIILNADIRNLKNGLGSEIPGQNCKKHRGFGGGWRARHGPAKSHLILYAFCSSGQESQNRGVTPSSISDF